jgi:signal transduction histidine kinase
VVVNIRRYDSSAEFSVNNPAVLPAGIKSRIFQRSFSTKGTGRGIGTYSMKMLGERYLGGKIAFTSAEGEGTTFRFLLPDEGRTEPE